MTSPSLIIEERYTPQANACWWMVEGKDCQISIERRPAYCDRGRFIAKIHHKPGAQPGRVHLDEQDGWPRYYFDQDCMLAEIEAWLRIRDQMPT